ncbi:MAG: transglutaminase-like domain-containing protein [Chitinophagales bacterium]|nr:transglutaminase domain-containing protein [Chitinophagales bacterium]HPE97407.1 transglutaminase-like domain-containing protein [Chitinophagales bacterium]HPR27718.1 transglutaminase-like domain-containing protein [Chitinophagales bacterium]HQU39650.1 transglutaminase-like domain-containing protein [Chitinophagales bacterium]HQU76139.1 transglutaminase-like domain-containing protein [Chitinophagales bacterium]
MNTYICTLLIGTTMLLSTTLHATTLEKSYFWEFEGKRYNLRYSFDADDYKYYKQIKRDYNDFTVYMKETPGRNVADDFALELNRMARQYKLNQKETVEFVASFVQHFRYRDDGKYEYPRYPAETLVEQGGDCEDTAILLAALLRSMGYETILLSPEGHMGVGLAVDGDLDGTGVEYQGEKYYYIETTNTGWGIGDYPDHLSTAIRILDPGSRVGCKPLALRAPGVKPSQANKDQATSSQASVGQHTAPQSGFQTDYTANKELVADDRGVLSTDTMVIDGQKQETVTYQSSGRIAMSDH